MTLFFGYCIIRTTKTTMLQGQDFSHVEAHWHEHKGVQELLSRPEIIVGIFASVFLFLGGAIRLTRLSAASTIQSFHTYVESDHQIEKRGLFYWITGNRGFLNSFKSFWGRVPRRIWNFYIEAFMVPGYRKEWGKFKGWSYRARDRPKKSPHLRRLLRTQKRLHQEAKKEETRVHFIPHNHTMCKRVKINVSGMVYETQLRTLERFPDTLLGSASKRIQFYDPVKQEYYFDRNRHAFEAILYFYQSGGRFRRPDTVQADVLLEDAQFYQLSPVILEQFRVEEGLSSTSSQQEIVPQNLLCRKIWLLFDYPESSVQAAYLAIISTGTLFLSIAVFCIETIDIFEQKPQYGLIDPTTGRIGVIRGRHTLDANDPFFFTEIVVNVWFITEVLVRFLSCPFYGKFLKDPLNLIDLIAVVPFLITLTSPSTSKLQKDDAPSAADSLYLLRVVRVVRVFRIFKLSRHSKGLKILGKTLRASLNELILLMFFIILGVVLFSSTMYFAELDNPNTQFDSIPGGFWWALITITTVGFGDVVPKTFLGKIVGSLCAVAGVLTIALPVPVIVSNFNFFYHQAIDEGDLRWININHVPACPYRPAGFNNSSQKCSSKRKKPGKNVLYSSDEEFGSLKKSLLN